MIFPVLETAVAVGYFGLVGLICGLILKRTRDIGSAYLSILRVMVMSALLSNELMDLVPDLCPSLWAQTS